MPTNSKSLNDYTIDLKQPTNKLTKRLQWIVDNLVLKFLNCLKEKEQIVLTAEQALFVLCQADPSENKSAVQWIIESYLKEGFLWEDLKDGKQSKVFDTLELFAKYNQQLEKDKRSVYNYRTLASLYRAIEPYVNLNLKSSNQYKNENRSQVQQQSCFLLETNGLKAVLPLTRFAAEWWGQGTRWCTAARINNLFDKYNNDAPLFILLFRDHENKPRKLQLWVTENDIQWMDEIDARIQIDFVKDCWEQLGPFVLKSIGLNGNMIRYVPFENLTHGLCKQAIDQTPLSLRSIDHNFLSKELCEFAFEKDKKTFAFFPQHLKTKQICLDAMTEKYSLLGFVPKNMRTKKIYLKAHENDPNCIRMIPEKYRTRKMYLKSVQKNGFNLEYVPEHMKTDEIYKQAVLNKAANIYKIPVKFLTEDLMLKLVEKDGCNLEFIPDEFKTEKICLAALANDTESLNYIPVQFQTQKMYDFIIFELNYLKLYKIPNKFKTLELCLQSVKNNIYTLMDVPEQMLKDNLKSFLEISLKISAKSLSFITIPLDSYEICDFIIRQNPCAVQFIRNNSISIKERNQLISLAYQLDPDCMKPLEEDRKNKNNSVNSPKWNLTEIQNIFLTESFKSEHQNSVNNNTVRF